MKDKLIISVQIKVVSISNLLLLPKILFSLPTKKHFSFSLVLAKFEKRRTSFLFSSWFTRWKFPQGWKRRPWASGKMTIIISEKLDTIYNFHKISIFIFILQNKGFLTIAFSLLVEYFSPSIWLWLFNKNFSQANIRKGEHHFLIRFSFQISQKWKKFPLSQESSFNFLPRY